MLPACLGAVWLLNALPVKGFSSLLCASLQDVWNRVVIAQQIASSVAIPVH